MRSLSETTSGGVLSLTDELMSQLKQKHPNPQSAKLGSLLFGPIDGKNAIDLENSFFFFYSK